MALQAGDALGPYQIIGQVGQGGMATVYKALQPKLDRYVAIKVMHAAFTDDHNFHARFEREARIVAKLEHPNIVPIYDYSDDAKTPYLVMKFIEGQTLKAYALKKGIALAEIEPLMRPIAAALDHAHQQGILHRDIKPSNILIGADGTPYLTDFGLARIAQSGESTMSADVMLGTPHYISPEQAKGEKTLDARTDLYSLGVILYELVVGRVPFTADTPYAIVHAHIYSAPAHPCDINPDIPSGIAEVLLKAVAKNPAERYPTATAMIDAFAAAVRTSGMNAIPTDNIRPQPDAIPAPPSPPSPPNIVTRHRGRRVKVDVDLDLGNLDTSNWGKRVEDGLRKGVDVVTNWAAQAEEWAAKLEERIESEADSKPRIRSPKRQLTPEEKARRRVEKKLEERQGLMIHFAAYFIVNLMLWAIFLANRDPGAFPWPLFPTAGWGIGMFSHFMDYWMKYGPGADRREALIAREIEREIERSQLGDKLKNTDKPKNDVWDSPPVRLTEDGELTDSFIQERDERDDYKGRRAP